MKNKELDQQILSIILKDDGSFNSSKVKSSFILKYYPELYNYLNQRFEDLQIDNQIHYREILYRIKNNIENKPLCPVCGNPLPFDYKRYKIYCCIDCKKSNKGKELMKQKNIQTCYKKYGVNSTAQAEIAKQHRIENNIKKYGVTHHNKVPEIKRKGALAYINKNIEEKQEIYKKRKITTALRYGNENFRNSEQAEYTCIEKYGVKNAFLLEKTKQNILLKYGNENIFATEYGKNKIKSTCQKKYNKDYYVQTDEFIQKAYLSKKDNGTFGKSKIEIKIFNNLKQIFNDIEYQYRSELYPFNCDFYIKSLDLYIELQGNWTHGKHPFNENDQKDINQLNLWKYRSTEINQFGNKKDYYLGAINTWTISDPLKRETAKKNNLNYLEIFSCHEKEIMQQIEKYVQDISAKLYESQQPQPEHQSQSEQPTSENKSSEHPDAEDVTFEEVK